MARSLKIIPQTLACLRRIWPHLGPELSDSPSMSTKRVCKTWCSTHLAAICSMFKWAVVLQTSVTYHPKTPVGWPSSPFCKTSRRWLMKLNNLSTSANRAFRSRVCQLTSLRESSAQTRWTWSMLMRVSAFQIAKGPWTRSRMQTST